MDTFFEQIVAIRKGSKEIFGFIGIWFTALLLTFILLFVRIPVITSFSFLIIAGVIYGVIYYIMGLL